MSYIFIPEKIAPKNIMIISVLILKFKKLYCKYLLYYHLY
ncbi:hypothetical protein XBKQ1_2640022 [Xenorhabdus bovienii str. kraussei Quebec]|uniref:Uncharacterized protein n=1 Tax=Xenorhabdus bovienii str. kraussei Quebec TaxID=1398203 RepID=A0A077PIM5_XENBV|nr:hypothetical protein XBKQ1_2640022 [Xenorhabdus bovienii str. kraussei Quebec]